jgi:hypothetical protein
VGVGVAAGVLLVKKASEGRIGAEEWFWRSQKYNTPRVVQADTRMLSTT